MAVVEYNNKAYFGEMTEGDKFTFAKMPFGKLDNPINWDQVKEGSFLINPRDKVKLDPKYIICNVKFGKQKIRLYLMTTKSTLSKQSYPNILISRKYISSSFFTTSVIT